MFCSLAFLPNLSQHEDHVCRLSVGSEPTLAYWHVFLCYRWDQPVQQVVSQDSARSGEWGDV